MRYLVTGSSGHLGEALVRVLRGMSEDVVAIDLKPGAFTDHVGTIVDPTFVARHMRGVTRVFHAATLHKPHLATHSRRDFVDTNIIGTLNLLDAAKREAIDSFVFTSTTSTFGDALAPQPEEPAAWITEDIAPRPKNIYGITKLAAEDLCWLAHRKDGLASIVLRTSRFFPEEQDDAATRSRYSAENSQVVEFLYRRADLEDVVSAHLAAAERAPQIGFGRYIVSATTPFRETDLPALRRDAASVVQQYTDYRDVFSAKGWSMYPSLDRVYVNRRAQQELGWQPRNDFSTVLNRVAAGGAPLSELAYTVGSKGYHSETFESGPYPVYSRGPSMSNPLHV